MYTQVFLLFSFWLLIMSSLSGQNLSKVDSLQKVLILEMDVENKVDILIRLSDEFLNNEPDKALNFAQDALTISEDQQYEFGQLESHINLAAVYQVKTDLKNSIEYAILAKGLASRSGVSKGICQVNINYCQ